MPKKSWIQGENEFWKSANMNNRTYLQYFNRLKDIAISSFKYKRLPKTVDERFLELKLFDEGGVALFRDDVLGYLALPFSNNSELDVYGNPVYFRAIGTNGYQKDLSKDDAVICWNNKLRTNSVFHIEQYAYRLYMLERALDTNVNAQKTPIMIRCAENQRLILKNLYMKYDGNQPFIFGDKDLDMTGVSVLKTDAPYLVDRLQNAKAVCWNEALTYLGIANVASEKRERMISDEVKRGMGGVMASRHSRLQARKQAWEDFNAMYGEDVDVEFNDEMLEEADRLEEDIRKEFGESEVEDNE